MCQVKLPHAWEKNPWTPILQRIHGNPKISSHAMEARLFIFRLWKARDLAKRAKFHVRSADDF